MAVILYLIIVLFALYQACADEFSFDQAPQGSSLAHELPRSQIARSYSNGQASLWPNNVGASRPVSRRRRAFTRSGREPLTEIKVRQSGERAWGGWQNTRYLFTLCVVGRVPMKCSANVKAVATHTPGRFYQALNAILT